MGTSADGRGGWLGTAASVLHPVHNEAVRVNRPGGLPNEYDRTARHPTSGGLPPQLLPLPVNTRLLLCLTEPT